MKSEQQVIKNGQQVMWVGVVTTINGNPGCRLGFKKSVSKVTLLPWFAMETWSKEATSDCEEWDSVSDTWCA